MNFVRVSLQLSQCLLLAACHSSLIFVDRPSPDGGWDGSDGSRVPVTVAFGGPSIGPEFEVSSHHETTTFGHLSLSNRLESQYVELGGFSGAKIGAVRLVAWTESSLGHHRLRAARIGGPDPDVRVSWVIDAQVDGEANPEVIARESGFTVIWSKPSGTGPLHNLFGVDVPLTGAFDGAPVRLPCDGERYSNVVAFQDRLVLVLGNEWGTVSLRSGSANEGFSLVGSAILPDSYVYRLRLRGEQLFLIMESEVLVYDLTEADPEPISLRLPPADDEESVIRLVDAVPVGQRWVIVTGDFADFDRHGGTVPAQIHLADATEDGFMFVQSVTSDTALTDVRPESRFLRPIAVVRQVNNRYGLWACRDRQCIRHRSSLSNQGEITSFDIVNGQLTRETADGVEYEDTSFVADGELLVNLCPFPAPGARSCRLSLRNQDNTVADFGPEADQSAPFLYRTGTYAGVIFRQGNFLRNNELGIRSEGRPFGDGLDAVYRVRNFAGSPFVETVRSATALEPPESIAHQLTDPPAEHRVETYIGPAVSACGGQLFEHRSEFLATIGAYAIVVTSRATGQSAEIPVTAHGAVLSTIVELRDRCVLLFADLRGAFVAPLHDLPDGLSFAPPQLLAANSNDFLTYGNQLGFVPMGDGFLLRGSAVDGNQRILFVQPDLSVRLLTATGFALTNESHCPEWPCQPTMAMQQIASDESSVLLAQRRSGNIEAVRLDVNGNEIFRGVLFELSEDPETYLGISTIGWTAALGTAPGTYVIAYQRFSPSAGSYRIFTREIRFLDHAVLE